VFDARFVSRLACLSSPDERDYEPNGQIDAFDDLAIMAGDAWDPRIKQKLESAGTVVLFISRHFLSSEYCTTLELKRAIERHEEGSARVVGILARECDWASLPLSKLQSLSKDGVKRRPLADWRGETGKDKACTQIAKQIRKIVEETAESGDAPPATAPTEPPAEPKKPLIAIPQPRWPQDLGVAMPDSLLLRPESGVVPFHSYRGALIDDILGWAMTRQPRIAVRLQAGEGGAGKTRMMIEVCRRLVRDKGWRAGFLSNGDGASADLTAEVACGKPCLIVMDYAETRRAAVISLTRTALQIPGTAQIRIMLLAREGRDWWDQLADGAADDPVTAGILRSPSTKTGPYRMATEEVPSHVRSDVFVAAVRAPAQSRDEAAAQIEPPDLSAKQFGNVLLIHFAALARLRGFESNRDIELLDAPWGTRGAIGSCWAKKTPSSRPCFRPSSKRLPSLHCWVAPIPRRTPRPSSPKHPIAEERRRS
jgi:hypothetical protein